MDVQHGCSASWVVKASVNAQPCAHCPNGFDVEDGLPYSDDIKGRSRAPETAADAQAVRSQIDKESTEMYYRASQNVSDLKLNWTDSFKTYKAQLQGFETRAAANEEAADKSEKETEKSLQRLKKLQTQKFAIEGTGIDLKRFTSGMAI